MTIARENCAECHGIGMRYGRGDRGGPCNCVARAIFRACYRRFCDCVIQERYLSTIGIERTSGRKYQCTYARKDEEYIADFCLVSRRALDDYEYQIFRFHYLLRADCKLCCRRLGIDAGLYFHILYRIEAKLGRTFRELQPYGLWPLDAYFGVRGCRTACSEVPPRIPSGRARRFPPFLLSA